MGKLSPFISQAVRKLNEENNIVASRLAVSLFLPRFWETGSLYAGHAKIKNHELGIHHFDVMDEEMQKNGELPSHELLEFCWYAAIPSAI